ncbi:MAG TPA: NAD(P)H-dependent oxidoreductase, partial [Oscillospiraceae bacterium]|nr:NAD(P)H-dependent oxidoreductase [Oscillospiraceae bacterium]
ASLGMGGTVTAQDHLVTLISFLDMDVMNDPRLTIPRVSKQADENGNLKLTDSAPFLKEQADAFLAFIEKRLK